MSQTYTKPSSSFFIKSTKLSNWLWQFRFSNKIAVMVINSTWLKFKSSENWIMWIFNFCSLIQSHSICLVQQSGSNENMKNDYKIELYRASWSSLSDEISWGWRKWHFSCRLKKWWTGFGDSATGGIWIVPALMSRCHKVVMSRCPMSKCITTRFRRFRYRWI